MSLVSYNSQVITHLIENGGGDLDSVLIAYQPIIPEKPDSSKYYVVEHTGTAGVVTSREIVSSFTTNTTASEIPTAGAVASHVNNKLSGYLTTGGLTNNFYQYLTPHVTNYINYATYTDQNLYTLDTLIPTNKAIREIGGKGLIFSELSPSNEPNIYNWITTQTDTKFAPVLKYIKSKNICVVGGNGFMNDSEAITAPYTIGVMDESVFPHKSIIGWNYPNRIPVILVINLTAYTIAGFIIVDGDCNVVYKGATIPANANVYINTVMYACV
jgi:hypothetical protein